MGGRGYSASVHYAAASSKLIYILLLAGFGEKRAAPLFRGAALFLSVW